MKAIVAVGFMDQCVAGARIYAKLKFPDPSAVLVHTVEPVLPDGGFLPETSSSPIAEIQNQRKTDGEARMAEIAAQLQALGIACSSVTRFGNPAHEVTELAASEGADLIVAGASRKGRLESFVMGSVARALVAGADRSILVGKVEPGQGPKINAVFATDHSNYADSCLDRLLKLAPQGLGTITVVSADTTSDDVALAVRAESPEGLTPSDILERKNQEACRRLRAVSDSTESVVLRGRATDVITAAMEQTKADLLIVGAHGHGFIQRLFMGSTAMHMVGNSPWNVLVLRV